MWKALLKDCAYYYDHPTLDDETKMRTKLQRKYDDILPAGWRPQLQSRRDLLHWGCNQVNAAFAEKGFDEKNLLPCDNHAFLLKLFGPDYDRLRPKLGYIKGLFENDQH